MQILRGSIKKSTSDTACDRNWELNKSRLEEFVMSKGEANPFFPYASDLQWL